MLRMAKDAASSEIHTKHINTLLAEGGIFEC
jgi:hypothetical protein